MGHVIRARQPALTRITQRNPNGHTVIVPNRFAVGIPRPIDYILNEEFSANNELIFRDDFNEPDIEVFADDFNRADPAPWAGISVNVSVAIDAARLSIENVTGSGGAAQVILTRSDLPQLVNGSWYKFAFLDVVSSSSMRVEILDSGALVLGQGVDVTTGGTAELVSNGRRRQNLL